MSDLKEPAKQELPQGNGSRRDWLFAAGVALNVIAGAALAVPLIGFIFSSFAEKKDPRDWISLGALDHFPEKTTRIATYRNPYTRPWDGQTADIPCWVRRVSGKEFQVFAINCTHLGCPVRWFQESGLFLCPWRKTNSGSRVGKCPLCQIRCRRSSDQYLTQSRCLVG